MNCYSDYKYDNTATINFSRRDYSYVIQSNINPSSLYVQNGSTFYRTNLNRINFGFVSNNNYSKIYNKDKVSWVNSDQIGFYNYSGRGLGNFWIAFENSLPVNLIFSNVKIGQNVGTVTSYGPNNKYTIVNFGDLSYTQTINNLSFEVKTDECSSIPGDMNLLPFKMFMGTSCSAKQFSKPTELPYTCQLSPIDFEIRIQNDGAELNDMILTNSNYTALQTNSTSQICDDIYYLATISNSSSQTYVYDNLVNINFPKGMELKEVYYQYGTGTTTTIPYELVGSNEAKIDLSSNIPTISQGFKSENNVNNPIKIKLKFKTNCQFSPSENEVGLVYSFTKYCGERKSLSNFDDNLQISGFENLNNVKLSLSSSLTDQITQVSDNGKVTITVKNTGNVSSENSKLILALPKELQYVTAEQGTPTVTGTSQLSFPISGLSPGQSTSVIFTVKDYLGNKAKEGLRPSACILENVLMTKTLQTNCSSTCDISADLANGKICIPLPPVDSIPVEISCSDCIESFAPYQGLKYVLSAWVKEDIIQNGLTKYTGPAIVLRFKLQETDLALEPMVATGEIIDGWQRIYQEFTIPTDAQNISVDLINTGNNEVFFDDIRIHPFEANMKSFVYDPISMKLVAELDENNYATFYEYDEEGALVRVKKETQRGIMTIKESRNNTIKK
jgi:hypothetical protein